MYITHHMYSPLIFFPWLQLLQFCLMVDTSFSVYEPVLCCYDLKYFFLKILVSGFKKF